MELLWFLNLYKVLWIRAWLPWAWLCQPIFKPLRPGDLLSLAWFSYQYNLINPLCAFLILELCSSSPIVAMIYKILQRMIELELVPEVNNHLGKVDLEGKLEPVHGRAMATRKASENLFTRGLTWKAR